MGRKNQYGYQEYRGRGGGRGRMVLLFIIALLAVLLAAGTAFYLLILISGYNCWRMVLMIPV